MSNNNLQELKNRVIFVLLSLIITFIACYCNKENLYSAITLPLKKINESRNVETTLIYTGMADAFITYLKLSIYSTLSLNTPIIIWQIYKYIAPGLYKKEKKVFILYAISSPILFITGAMLVYLYIIPLAWSFFINFENTGTVKMILLPNIDDYLSLFVNLIFAFGLSFQMPLLLGMLSMHDIVTKNMLKRKRRMAIVIIFTVSAVLTPPDIISQIGLAVPLMILYELSILLCKSKSIIHNTSKNLSQH